jgi:hypothetical protein
MCTTVLSQTQAHVKHCANGQTPATPEEIAERMQAFEHITQAEVNRLRRMVYGVVPSDLWDPEDALAGALLAAVKGYKGLGKLSTYVCKSAINHALANADKLKYHDFWSDLDAKDEFEEGELLEKYHGRCDDEPVLNEPVSKYLIEGISRTLDELADQDAKRRTKGVYPPNDLRPNVIALAKQILAILADNANQAAGIGIDEYDSPQCRTVREKPKSYRVRYNKMEARASINANLEKATGETRNNVMYAMIALRKAAALHAICEHATK